MKMELEIVWLSRKTLDTEFDAVDQWLIDNIGDRTQDWFMVTQYEHGCLRHMTPEDYKTGIGFKDKNDAMLFKLSWG